MNEQQVFSFDEKVYKRNKLRRFLRNLGIILFFFPLIFLALIAFYSWGGDGSFILDQEWRSIGNLIPPLFVGAVISYFIAPDPAPKQTIRISSNVLEIEQELERFEIAKSSITGIQEFHDYLVIKKGIEKYQVSKDVNDFGQILTKLDQWLTINNRTFTPLLMVLASIVIVLGLYYAMYFFLLQSVFWPIYVLVILFAGFFIYSLYYQWNKLPFENSDKRIMKRNRSMMLAAFALIVLILLLSAIFAYYLFYIRLPNLLS